MLRFKTRWKTMLFNMKEDESSHQIQTKKILHKIDVYLFLWARITWIFFSLNDWCTIYINDSGVNSSSNFDWENESYFFKSHAHMLYIAFNKQEAHAQVLNTNVTTWILHWYTDWVRSHVLRRHIRICYGWEK